jgi:F-type H+-transporting ATPase subunit b
MAAIHLSLPGADVELSCGSQNGTAGVDCKPIEQHNPILPETSELIWGLISFLILFGLMAKFALPAVKKSMDARTERIRGDLDEAEKAKTDAEGLLSEYQRQLADAKAEANRIIEAARQQAEKVKADVVAATNTEVNEMKLRAAADIDAARAAAVAQLQGQVGSLAIELAEKVVERNLDKDTNQRLIESFIQRVGS